MKISVVLFVGVACCALAISGCDYSLRQDMANQPYNHPLSPSDFFPDGRSERPLIENTVPRGAVENDVYSVAKDYAGYPLPVNEKLLRRGQDRYKIFCTPCHGLQGDGNGMAAVRGMKHPPSYHIDRLRQAPNGYFYDVITNGFGAMYSYNDKVAVDDRWRIAAYIRALQLSQNVAAANLESSERQKLEESAR